MAEERLILAVSDNPVIYDLTMKGYHDKNIKNKAWRDVSAILGVSADKCKKKWKYLRDKYLKERKLEMDRKRSGAMATSHKRWKYMGILGFLEPHCRERATTSNLVVVQGGKGVEEGEVSGEIMALLGPMMSPQREVVESEEEAAGLTAGPSAHSSEDTSQPSARLSGDLSESTSPPSPPRTSTRVRETSNCPSAFKKRKTSETTLTPYQQSVLSVLERQTDEDEHFMMSLVPSVRRLTNQKKAQVHMRFLQVLYDVQFGEM
ncbi:transcription factor Adf-1-like [Conger conger]|uniref:transcription factor Adf-1-like n=1 Tax=Conger conger TaxID=82655 RepID=UPI002A5A8E5E|nr:transcription factor Adf-1-like [Conger conger]